VTQLQRSADSTRVTHRLREMQQDLAEQDKGVDCSPCRQRYPPP
jgi:hypothetical protein